MLFKFSYWSFLAGFTAIAVVASPGSIPKAQAHSVTGAFGSVEVMPPGHYHFHMPLEIDLAGHLHLESMLPSKAGHSKEAGDDHKKGGSVAFVLNGDYDQLRRKVVRESYHLPVESWFIPLARSNVPRWLYTNRNGSLGIGPEAELQPVSFGLIPGRESSLFHRTLCLNSTCEQTPLKRLPESIQNWKKSVVGERINYSKSFGVHFHLPLGPHGAFSAAIAPVIESSWQISLEKTSPHELTIEAGRSKTLVAGAELVALVGGLSGNWIKSQELYFKFVLDLNDPLAQFNYSQFLAGRIDVLQKLAQGRQGIQYQGRAHGNSRSYSAGGMVGIPVLAGVGVEASQTRITTTEGGHVSHATVIQSLIRGRGRLSRHLLRGNFIVANVECEAAGHPGSEDSNHEEHDHAHPDEHGCEQDEHPDHEKSEYQFASLWIFERDRTTDERIENWLKRLGRRSAMPELSRFRMDDRAEGYIRAEVSLQFSPELIRGWLGLNSAHQVRIPEVLRTSRRWQQLSRSAQSAVAHKKNRALSSVLAQAVALAIRDFESLRKEWSRTPPEYPVIMRATFSGENIANSVKTWKIGN